MPLFYYESMHGMETNSNKGMFDFEKDKFD